MAFEFAYLHLTLAHSKGQANGPANFNCEYLTNDKRGLANINIAIKCEFAYGQLIVIAWSILKVMVRAMHDL